MRLIIGPLRVELEPGDDPADLLRGLFRRIDNSELAGIFGITPRTLYRWRQAGRLPWQGKPMLVDVLSLMEGRKPGLSWSGLPPGSIPGLGVGSAEVGSGAL